MAGQIEVVHINDEKIKEVASTPPRLSLEAPPLQDDAKEENQKNQKKSLRSLKSGRNNINKWTTN